LPFALGRIGRRIDMARGKRQDLTPLAGGKRQDLTPIVRFSAPTDRAPAPQDRS
jgi:hypothetical protein